MGIESADQKFNLRLEDWLKADDFNFAHDSCGIQNNIQREGLWLFYSEICREKKLKKIEGALVAPFLFGFLSVTGRNIFLYK